MHGDPARLRPDGAGRRGRRGDRARAWRRSPSATPRDRGVRMGALACLEQRDEVARARQGPARPPARSSSATPTTSRSSTPTPTAARSCRRCCCAATTPEPPSRTTSRRSARSARVMHLRLGRARRRARRPRAGSLVGSVVHPRPGGRARVSCSALAPWHGRMLVLDRDDATESTGHGSPLPMLVHGGPGRAGGGEELGGIRGVLHHMQRTADPGVAGHAHGGHRPLGDRRAARRSTARSTRSASRLAELQIGDAVERRAAHGHPGGHRPLRRVHRRHLLRPHRPRGRGREPVLRRRSSRTATWWCPWQPACSWSPSPGPVLANYGLENLRFLTPVKAGDAITVALTAKQITPRDDRRIRRGPVGLPWSPTRTASPSRSTTC